MLRIAACCLLLSIAPALAQSPERLEAGRIAKRLAAPLLECVERELQNSAAVCPLDALGLSNNACRAEAAEIRPKIVDAVTALKVPDMNVDDFVDTLFLATRTLAYGRFTSTEDFKWKANNFCRPN